MDLNAILDKLTGKDKEIDLPTPTDDDLAEMDVFDPPDPSKVGDDRKMDPTNDEIAGMEA